MIFVTGSQILYTISPSEDVSLFIYNLLATRLVNSRQGSDISLYNIYISQIPSK